MSKKALFFIYTLTILTTGLFAQTASQSKYLNRDGYVDIGYQDIAKTPETSIAKELVLIPAKVKKLDEIVDYRTRTLDTHNCYIDDDESEMCPKDTGRCDAHIQYSDGFSKEYDAVRKLEANPVLVTEAASEVAHPCNDHYLSVFYFYVPSQNKIQILYSNASPGYSYGHNCGGYSGGFVLSSFNNISRNSYNGRFTLDIQSHGHGCSSYTKRVTLENLPEVDKELTLWEAVALMNERVPGSSRGMRNSDYGGFYFFNIAFCDAGGAQWPTTIMKGKVEEFKCSSIDGVDYNLEATAIVDNKNCPPPAPARHQVRKENNKWHYYDASADWYGTNGRGLDLLITDIGTEYELKWRYLKDGELGGDWTDYKTTKVSYGGTFKDTFNILDWGGFILDTKKGILKSNGDGENNFSYTVGSFAAMQCVVYNRKCIGYMPYKYYTYHCLDEEKPDEIGITWDTINSKGSWYGPKIPGGDCGGIGLDSEKRCQPANPPSKNCKRTFFTCPLNSSNPCYKEPTDSSPINENYQGIYEYTAGTGETIKKTIHGNRVCFNGGSFVDGACTLEVIPKCTNGGTMKNGKCEKQTQQNQCKGEFIPSTGICLTEPSMTCAEGYSYDDFRQKCVAPQECEKGYILTFDGTCELDYSYTNYSCPSGWEGPIYGSDNDCKGSCALHGCECNSPLPPMQNCRRELRPNQQNSYEVKERTPMLIYSVVGAGLAPNNAGQVMGIGCDDSKPCPSNISKIVSERGGLAFYTNDGKKEFIKVSGCSFSGTLGTDHHEVRDFYIDKDLKTIKSRKSPGQITSTCQLNGHVGWDGREEGITSIAPKSIEKPYVSISAQGAGKTYDAEWEGFNVALMAIQLSDGHWYVIADLKDKNGNKLQRDIPKGVMGLPADYYRLDLKNSDKIKCTFTGVETPGYCANELQVVMPEKSLFITAISDIYSLAKKEKSKENDLNFRISFGKDKTTYQYVSGNGVFATLNLEIPATEIVTAYSDKLIFWDSYLDGDIGFLEFVRNVKPKDKEKGFVPDNMTPYNMALKGYTSIDNVKAEVGFGSVAKASTATYFIAPQGTSTCSQDANELKGVIISYKDLLASKASSIINRGAVSEKSCVIRVVEPNDFQSVLYASKTKAHTNNFVYMCSKWACVGAQCTIAKCPTDRVNINGKMQEIEFRGNIIPDMIRAKIGPDACLAQECDGAYPHGEVCGIRYQPTLKSPSVGKQDDTYLHYYCEEGTLSETGKSCYVKRCPNGTKEQADGSCKKEK